MLQRYQILKKEFEPESDFLPVKNKTILLIDDEEMVANITEMMLKKLGHKILKASSGPEALNLFEAYRTQIDLVICDMIMPNMDGLELIHRLRAIDFNVKVLLSSGSLIDEDEKDVINRGFNGLVKKPYKIKTLSQKIAEVLN